jgi:hypothetical protein
VTSKALSRLGARVTFVPQDEPGRGRVVASWRRWRTPSTAVCRARVAVAVLITNGWDLAENSVAQQLAEANEPDVLSITTRRRRPVVHEQGGPAEDPQDRVRRFGAEARPERQPGVGVGEPGPDRGRGVEAGQEGPESGGPVLTGTSRRWVSGAWLQDGQYGTGSWSRDRPKSGPVCLGFDGSDVDDWSAIRLETFDFHQFTPLDASRPADDLEPGIPGGEDPRLEVMAAFEHIFADVRRGPCLPGSAVVATEVNFLQGSTATSASSSGRRIPDQADARGARAVEDRHHQPDSGLSFDTDPDAGSTSGTR